MARKYGKKRTKRRIKGRLIFLISVVLFLLIFWLFLSYNVNPIIRKVSEEKVRQLATTAVNNATNEAIGGLGTDYGEILQISKSSEGEIELIQINSLLLNSAARKIVTLSQAYITEMGEQGIAIPIGTLSGMTYLAGRGPDINIKVFPVGSVSVTFESGFSAAGINQTRHKITLFVESNLSVIMPGLSKAVKITTEVALCENIIVGKVPEVYLESNKIDKILDLLP